MTGRHPHQPGQAPGACPDCGRPMRPTGDQADQVLAFFTTTVLGLIFIGALIVAIT